MKPNPGTSGTRRLRRAGRSVAFLLLLVLPALAVASVAAEHPPENSHSVKLYSNNNCGNALGSANIGTRIFGGGNNHLDDSGRPYSLWYVDPSNHTVQENALSTSSAHVCDSTGYLIPATESEGTWTMVLVNKNGSPVMSSTFSVVAPLPDLPSGAFILLVPFAFLYLYARRRGAHEGRLA